MTWQKEINGLANWISCKQKVREGSHSQETKGKVEGLYSLEWEFTRLLKCIFTETSILRKLVKETPRLWLFMNSWIRNSWISTSANFLGGSNDKNPNKRTNKQTKKTTKTPQQYFDVWIGQDGQTLELFDERSQNCNRLFGFFSFLGPWCFYVTCFYSFQKRDLN